MMRNIAERWRLLSGEDSWKELLDPLDIDLRQYIIHYGELAQATYDAFNSEKASKFFGQSKYSKKNFFSNVGLLKGNPYQYNVTKFLYATSEIKIPLAFLVKSHFESNWIGYVAVATDEGKSALGRRDIAVAWRGTVEAFEWADDFDFPLVSASYIYGKENDSKIHQGWLSIYTSHDPDSTFNTTSVRDQVLDEVRRLVELYKDEEISITISGHSLGAALGTLNAGDITANGIAKLQEQPDKPCPVTAFLFASPRVGDKNFKNFLESMDDLHLLRTRNAMDIVPNLPPLGYSTVGEELEIDTSKSKYLKSPGDFRSWHSLEVYLHGVAGTHGKNSEFHLEVERSVALVNKSLGFLRDEQQVPESWWCEENKGMVQDCDGSWRLQDYEEEQELRKIEL